MLRYRHCLLALLLVCCSQPAEQRVDVLEEAKDAYYSGHFQKAIELFSSIESGDAHADAVYGLAKAQYAVNLHEEAIESYERARALQPEVTSITAEYVKCLTWGAIMVGRIDWAEKAFEVSRSELLRQPSQVGILENLPLLLDKVAVEGGYLGLLHELRGTHPDAVEIEAQIKTHQYDQARMLGDAELEPARKSELELMLANLEDAPITPGALYAKALIYTKLDRREELTPTLDALDSLPRGWEMSLSLRYWNEYMRRRHGIEDIEERREFYETWAAKLKPVWPMPVSFHSTALANQWEVVLSIADDQSELDAQQLAEIIDLSERVIRTDTSRKPESVQKIGQFLIRKNAELDWLEEVLAAQTAAVESDEPGIHYPGDRGEELARAKRRALSEFRRLNGEILWARGDADAAFRLFQEAHELEESALTFASLGRMYEHRGQQEEALEHFLDALTRSYARFDEHGATRAKETLVASGYTEQTLQAELDRREARWREQREERALGQRIDEPAPMLSLHDLDGNPWSLEQQNGKTVVLNFWATNCGPCIMAMPHYQELADAYADRDDVTFLAISQDAESAVLKQWLSERSYTFDVAQDTGAGIQFGVLGTPTTLVIGSRGRIQYRLVGFSDGETYTSRMKKRIERV
ncbi:MAG: redoxin domain-containing protein, partial [Thermoanaerobaculia bacterium]|nr:redoxin domain-containing protein [Thermoanaerobaculia bacterium]